MASQTKLLDLGTRQLAQVLQRGEADPVDVMDELAERVANLPSEINPFITVDLAMAGKIARRMSDIPVVDRQGALFGIPMSVKDIVPTRDLPTTFGMAALDRRVPREDGSFVTAARRAGSIVYAKSNTPPNAYADVTDNLLVGPTANPHDLQRTAGGSSGGAGAVVASGLEALTHGTDAGGSVRMPASHCGVVGFKPSYGLLPRTPAPDLWGARGHHGLIGRTVDDIEYGMDALVGADPRDPLSLGRRDWLDSGERATRGRIGVALSLFGQPVSAAVRRVFGHAVDKLSDAGIALQELDITWPDPVDQAADQMAAAEHHLFGDLLAERPELFDAGHAGYIRRGSTVSISDYLAAQHMRGKLYAEATALMDDLDAIVTPTLPITSWLLTEDRPEIDGVPVGRGPGSRWPDLLLANLLGWPAVSIPAGWVDGLPVGLHILSPWRADKVCLGTAADFASIINTPNASTARARQRVSNWPHPLEKP